MGGCATVFGYGLGQYGGDVIALCRAFQREGVEVWIDGGWGVDALLGEQTRGHTDLDLAIRDCDVPALLEILAPLGFAQTPRDDDVDWNFVLSDKLGRSVDVHAFIFDAKGYAILGDPALSMMYPLGALEGCGTVGDLAVRCVAAPFVLQFRASFPPRGVDHHDVAALCNRFGLPVPSPFRATMSTKT